MAVLLLDPPESLADQGVPHKRWTREEVRVLESTGLFEGQHYELIDGELIDKMGKNRRHIFGTTKLFWALVAAFGELRVDQEVPIDVHDADNPKNEPEPDLTVLRRDSSEFTSSPTPADIVMVVEVADTSIGQDKGAKSALYARAGIPEYWILDINLRLLLVRRGPSGAVYQSEHILTPGDSVSPLEKPDHAIPVASLLP